MGSRRTWSLAEKHNEKLASRGSDPLETYVRDLLTKLPDGTKVSIGGQWGKTFAFGVPGRSFVFVNPMVDYCNKANGFSLSIGGGPLKYGGFINLSYMEGRYGFRLAASSPYQLDRLGSFRSTSRTSSAVRSRSAKRPPRRSSAPLPSPAAFR